jgi:hypothetical protein
MFSKLLKLLGWKPKVAPKPKVPSDAEVMRAMMAIVKKAFGKRSKK